MIEEIKSKAQPFDWNTAPTDIIYKALQVTNYPLTIGYENNSSQADAGIVNELLNIVKASEGINKPNDDLLVHHDETLNFFYINPIKIETIELLRKADDVSYIELPAYPLLIEKLNTSNINDEPNSEINYRSRVLDPLQTSPDYFNQLQNYSDGSATSFRRHNVDKVYRNHQIYGAGIGIAVLDNGLLPDHQTFLFENGYGSRVMQGYYNPFFFLPWTQSDGIAPQSLDAIGLSQFIEGQWLHGWSQNQQVLMAAPNATQYSVRSSPVVLIMVPSQTLGIVKSLKAMANDPAIHISSMSMGSLVYIHQMKAAIDYYHSKDKLLFSAAGTSFLIVKDLLGVIFPAWYEPVVAVTGIENREVTDGAFITGESSHNGPQLDFCTEREKASSEATSKMAGMAGLVWSANPELNREEVLDILVESSYFYNTTGHKDPLFGWGTPDILEAVEAALD